MGSLWDHPVFSFSLSSLSFLHFLPSLSLLVFSSHFWKKYWSTWCKIDNRSWQYFHVASSPVSAEWSSINSSRKIALDDLRDIPKYFNVVSFPSRVTLRRSSHNLGSNDIGFLYWIPVLSNSFGSLEFQNRRRVGGEFLKLPVPNASVQFRNASYFAHKNAIIIIWRSYPPLSRDVLVTWDSWDTLPGPDSWSWCVN